MKKEIIDYFIKRREECDYIYRNDSYMNQYYSDFLKKHEKAFFLDLDEDGIWKRLSLKKTIEYFESIKDYKKVEKLRECYSYHFIGSDVEKYQNNKLLIEYFGSLDNEEIIEQIIPADAHSFEVFAIKDCDESSTGKQAFIGFKLKNGDFHFIGVPYTENKK